jgi:hypothetical protein
MTLLVALSDGNAEQTSEIVCWLAGRKEMKMEPQIEFDIGK